MSTKARIKITVVIDTELKPEYYPECDTDESRLALALAGANEDPYSWMDSPEAEWTITGELELKS